VLSSAGFAGAVSAGFCDGEGGGGKTAGLEGEPGESDGEGDEAVDFFAEAGAGCAGEIGAADGAVVGDSSPAIRTARPVSGDRKTMTVKTIKNMVNKV
jgi:hypothetical protein